jgi:DNA-directed RNA polymerase III subunit RPC1
MPRLTVYCEKFQGAANKHGECSTCHGSFSECPGHFGYLKLALPVFNIGFFSNILDVVKCICKVSPRRSSHYQGVYDMIRYVVILELDPHAFAGL